VSVTDKGRSFFADLGIDLEALARHRRQFARACLDWSERRPHLGGAVGAALTAGLFARGWLARVQDSRGVRLTVPGRMAFERTLGVDLREEEGRSQAEAAPR
jgi:hypothetical protein